MNTKLVVETRSYAQWSGICMPFNTRQTGHFNTKQMDAILFSFVLVEFLNCRASMWTKHLNQSYEQGTKAPRY